MEEGLAAVLDKAVADAGVKPVINESTELEITCRKTEEHKYYFVMNFKDKDLKLPSCFAGGTDLLTGERVREGEIMSRFDVKLISRNRE